MVAATRVQWTQNMTHLTPNFDLGIDVHRLPEIRDRAYSGMATFLVSSVGHPVSRLMACLGTNIRVTHDDFFGIDDHTGISATKQYDTTNIS